MRFPRHRDASPHESGGFTLRELCISLTIVAALFLGGFLVAHKVDRLLLEARAVKWTRDIQRGLHAFAEDHEGAYPDVARDPSHARLRQGIDRETRPVELGLDTATENFSALIGGAYYNEETVYHLEGECYATGRFCPPPDRDITTPLLPENVAWAYVRGLDKDSADAGTPLVMTRNHEDGPELRWPRQRGRVGGVLDGKIAVAFIDGSSRLILLDDFGVARDEMGRDITSAAPGTPYPYDRRIQIIQP